MEHNLKDIAEGLSKNDDLNNKRDCSETDGKVKELLTLLYSDIDNHLDANELLQNK